MLSATLLLAVGARALIKVGDTLPDVTLDLGFPPEKVNVLERGALPSGSDPGLAS